MYTPQSRVYVWQRAMDYHNSSEFNAEPNQKDLIYGVIPFTDKKIL